MNMIGKTLQVWWPSLIILKKTPVWWPFLLSHRRHESSDDHLLWSQRKPRRMTISWRQVRRKNWWLAQAAFPPSRCRSYVWIVTDKTGKNNLIEKKYNLFPQHDRWQSIHRIFARCAKESHLIAVQSKIYFSLVLSSYEGKPFPCSQSLNQREELLGNSTNLKRRRSQRTRHLASELSCRRRRTWVALTMKIESRKRNFSSHSR